MSKNKIREDLKLKLELLKIGRMIAYGLIIWKVGFIVALAVFLLELNINTHINILIETSTMLKSRL